jgi:LysM repeat protein
VTIDFDLDDDDAIDNRGRAAVDDVDDEPPARRSPLRTILLVLLILILLCVVCTVVVRNFGSALPFTIPFLSLEEAVPAQVQPATDTPIPVDSGEAPAETTVVVTTEAPTSDATAEQPVTVEATEAATPAEPAPTGEGEPTTEATDAVEPTTEATGEAESTAEATATSAATAVPGPTSTPGPTVVVTVVSCDNNTPPTADANGPYNGMMGKGLAIVTFDGSASTDADGTIDSYEWDFGDGSERGTGATVTHGYAGTGGYVVTLTVTDNCVASSQTTVEVTITGPTPPSSSETPAPEATSEGSSTASATMGFCYRVQSGDALSDIAWRYRVPASVLANVNSIDMDYVLIVDQGLFIPTGPLRGESNAYQIQNGDSLDDIAYQCGLSAGMLANINGLTANAALTPGQNLIIPPWGQVHP